MYTNTKEFVESRTSVSDVSSKISEETKILNFEQTFTFNPLWFDLYLYNYENVCVCVCVFAFFSAIFKPIGTPFGTQLLFGPGKVLTQRYIL